VDVVTVVVAMVGLVLTGAGAGVFFTFSNSIMPGLDAVRAEQAVAAMNSINVKIINPLFLAAFLGPPVVAALTGVLLLGDADTDAGGAALLFFAAAVVYVLGAIVPTAAVNVPLNNALAAAPVPTGEAEVTRVWTDYSTRWTRWNHWRAVGSLAALVLMGIGLLVWDYAG